MAGKTDGFLADCCFKHPPCWWTFSECAMFIHVCQLDPKFPLLNPDCSRLNPNICCLILNVSLLDFPRSGSNPQKIPEVCPLKKHEKTWKNMKKHGVFVPFWVSLQLHPPIFASESPTILFANVWGCRPVRLHWRWANPQSLRHGNTPRASGDDRERPMAYSNMYELYIPYMKCVFFYL